MGHAEILMLEAAMREKARRNKTWPLVTRVLPITAYYPDPLTGILTSLQDDHYAQNRRWFLIDN